MDPEETARVVKCLPVPNGFFLLLLIAIFPVGCLPLHHDKTKGYANDRRMPDHSPRSLNAVRCAMSVIHRLGSRFCPKSKSDHASWMDSG